MLQNTHVQGLLLIYSSRVVLMMFIACVQYVFACTVLLTVFMADYHLSFDNAQLELHAY